MSNQPPPPNNGDDEWRPSPPPSWLQKEPQPDSPGQGQEARPPQGPGQQGPGGAQSPGQPQPRPPQGPAQQGPGQQRPQFTQGPGQPQGPNFGGPQGPGGPNFGGPNFQQGPYGPPPRRGMSGGIIALIVGGGLFLLLIFGLGLFSVISLLASDSSNDGGLALPGDDTTETTTGNSIALPKDGWVDPELPAQPAGGDQFTTKVKYELTKNVITAAGINSPITVTCSPDPLVSTKNSTATCSVLYQGVSVPATVEITGGTYYASYRAILPKLALTKQKAEHELLYQNNYYDDIQSASCDMAAVQLVDVDREGAVMCQLNHTDGRKTTQRLELSPYGSVYFYGS